jgi:hypothetical protein
VTLNQLLFYSLPIRGTHISASTSFNPPYRHPEPTSSAPLFPLQQRRAGRPRRTAADPPGAAGGTPHGGCGVDLRLWANLRLRAGGRISGARASGAPVRGRISGTGCRSSQQRQRALAANALHPRRDADPPSTPPPAAQLGNSGTP